MDQSQEGETVNSNDKADAAWDDYVSQQQEEKIEELERELNAAHAEIQILKYNIDRVMGMYAAKDNQICNLLHICRANGIDVSSQDLINGKEAKL